jgi:hypothetical protein
MLIKRRNMVNWEEFMRDLQGEPQSTLDSEPVTRNEAVDTDIKKKSIDEMIEEFKQKSPMKNQKKTYRGVF